MSALPASTAAMARSAPKGALWALLFGNFVIGSGVMSVAGTLNDMAQSLQVSVALAGQLIAIAAAVMCFYAPLLAGVVAGWDRRKLLTAALFWYAAGHVLCALMPSYAALWPVRAVTVLAAAVFTPQAAAAVGFMSPAEHRGRNITFIFLGWSIASVAGLPLAAWIGETYGWRWSFHAVGALGLVGAAWVWAAMPSGVKPAALSWKAWREALTHPVLMAMVAVTALAGAGQFTLFSYMAPYFRQALHASPQEVSLLFAFFGVFGLLGNVLLSNTIDRVGAGRAVAVTILCIATTLVLWPLAVSVWAMAAVLVPWGLGCFASNSAQQARLGMAAPALASALMALNTSAIYFGQAAGAAGGGWLIAHGGYAPLPWVGLAWLAAALVTSLWVDRQPV